MSTVIDNPKESVLDETQRHQVQTALAPSMADDDWDTQDTYLGIVPAVDSALRKHYPEWFENQ